MSTIKFYIGVYLTYLELTHSIVSLHKWLVVWFILCVNYFINSSHKASVECKVYFCVFFFLFDSRYIAVNFSIELNLILFFILNELYKSTLWCTISCFTFFNNKNWLIIPTTSVISVSWPFSIENSIWYDKLSFL